MPTRIYLCVSKYLPARNYGKWRLISKSHSITTLFSYQSRASRCNWWCWWSNSSRLPKPRTTRSTLEKWENKPKKTATPWKTRRISAFPPRPTLSRTNAESSPSVERNGWENISSKRTTVYLGAKIVSGQSVVPVSSPDVCHRVCGSKPAQIESFIRGQFNCDIFFSSFWINNRLGRTRGHDRQFLPVANINFVCSDSLISASRQVSLPDNCD